MYKNILILGGNGLVGSCLVKSLSELNYKITATYNNNDNRLFESKKVTYKKCNIEKKQMINNLFLNKKFDVVINTISDFETNTPKKNSIEKFIKVNIVGHQNLIENSINNKVSLFIYFSSIAVYEENIHSKSGFSEESGCNPKSLYGASKIYAEKLLKINCLNSKLKGITLRISGVHGAERNSGVINKMFNDAIEFNKIFVAEPNSKFKLTFTEDLTLAVGKILEAKHKETYEVYNLAGDDTFTLKSLAVKIAKVVGSAKITTEKKLKKRNQCMDTSKFKKKFNFKSRNLTKKLVTVFKSYN